MFGSNLGLELGRDRAVHVQDSHYLIISEIDACPR